MQQKHIFYIISFLLFLSVHVYSQTFNIKDFGAVPDGRTLNSSAIQKAIDQAGIKGGIVIIPAGRFLTGTIRLKSNVELHLDEGAVLLGSVKWADYQKNRWYAMILCKDQQNIAITGKGMIDGQGRELAGDVMRLIKEGVITDTGSYITHKRPDEKFRPQLIEFRDCENVRIEQVTLKNASCWVQTYGNCTNLLINNIKVVSTAYWNNDGIDVVDCKDVIIKDCDVNSSDDGICLKSGDPGRKCENIKIANCRIRSSASALKFGTPSHGGFKDITINNLYIYDTYRTAIALELVDGGAMENIKIAGVKAVRTGGAIFIRLGERKPTAPNGIIRGVHIENVNVDVPLTKPDEGYEIIVQEKGKHNPYPSSIVGLPGHRVQDITLENIEVNFSGGARKDIGFVPLDKLESIPERPSNYPEFSMFGELPAWGFYIRHAGGIIMKNVRLSYKETDFRPVMLFDDVKDLTIDGLKVKATNSMPAIVLNNVINESINKISIPGSKRNIIKKQ